MEGNIRALTTIVTHVTIALVSGGHTQRGPIHWMSDAMDDEARTLPANIRKDYQEVLDDLRAGLRSKLPAANF